MGSSLLAVKPTEFRTGAILILTVKDISQITSDSPRISNGGCKAPSSVHAPIAHGIKDRSASRVEGFGHCIVTVVGELGCSFLSFIKAVVVLKIIDLSSC